MSSGRIGSVALWVSDLELSASFYRDVVGLPLTFSDPHEPENVPHYETMWNGDGRLLDELDWSKEGPSEPVVQHLPSNRHRDDRVPVRRPRR